MNTFQEIRIRDITGFHIGSAEYEEAATGCTVILADEGAVTGIDIRGGAPASREAGLLDPLAANDSVNAVLLSGGSAFGLNAAGGVVQYLEERGIGFPTGAGVVPIVCASCLFDLAVGSASVRPDAELGYKACVNAETNSFREGSYGAGTGASVGKIMGSDYSMKSGLATYAAKLGDLFVAAIVAVNAVGDIYNYHNGEKAAGMRDPKTGEFIDAEDALYHVMNPDLFHQNTTIGAILTNADLDKTALTKVAGFAHDGYARAIRPVHTMFDGDSVYAISTRKVKADLNVVGTLAARAMAEAILKAGSPEGPSYGLQVNQ